MNRLNMLYIVMAVLMTSTLFLSCAPEDTSAEGEEYEVEMDTSDESQDVGEDAPADGEESAEADEDAGAEADADEPDAPFQSADVDGFDFSWRIEGENIRLRVGAQTTGWVAVGFDPDSVMRGANMLIGYVSGTEQVLEDHFGNTMVTHIPDTRAGGTDDIIEYEMTEADGYTSFEALIPLSSGDDRDRVLSEGGQHRVIFAHGPDNGDNTFVVHVRHAAVNLEL